MTRATRKRLLGIWQRLEYRLDALRTIFDRTEAEATSPLEIISTEGWSDQEKQAWIEEQRRRHEAQRAKRRRKASGGDNDGTR